MKSILLSILFVTTTAFGFAKRMNPIYVWQGNWQIVSVGEKVLKPFKSTKNIVNIGSDSRIAVNIGCNQIGSSITAIGGTNIGFSECFSTKMMCTPILNTKENMITKLLPKIDKYISKNNNNVLEFFVKNKKVLVLKKVSSTPIQQISHSEPKLSLEGTYRLIQQVEKGKTIEHLQDKITISFTKKEINQVSGYSGCNTFGGRYIDKEENGFTLNEIVATEMACSPEISAAEGALFDNLNNTDRYKLETNKLLLYQGRQLLMMWEKVN